MVGDHYEVKVEGEWTPVPNDKINNVVAPDGGAHVRAPRQVGSNKGVLAVADKVINQATQVRDHPVA